MRILTTYPYFAAYSLATVGRHHKEPFSTGYAEEAAARDKHCRGRLAKFKVDVVCLSHADIFGYLVAEGKIGTELSVAHLGIDSAYCHRILHTLTLECTRKPRCYTIDVTLIDVDGYLILAEHVYLSYQCSGTDILPKFGRKTAQLPVVCGLHLQIVCPLAHKCQILLHIIQTLLHLGKLHTAIERILMQTLDEQVKLALCKFVVLFGTQILLARG